MKIMVHGMFGHIKAKGKLTAAGGGCSLMPPWGMPLKEEALEAIVFRKEAVK